MLFIRNIRSYRSIRFRPGSVFLHFDVERLESAVAQEGVDRRTMAAELHVELHGILAAAHLEDVFLE